MKAQPLAAAVIAILVFLGCSDRNPVDIAIDGARLYAGTVGALPLSGPAAALNTPARNAGPTASM